jgi:hypothetical protein
MSSITEARRTRSNLPVDPYMRAAYLETKVGSRVVLTSGDFAIEGILVTVLQPAKFADHPTPVVIIDTGLERVAGPVLEGDRLA